LVLTDRPVIKKGNYSAYASGGPAGGQTFEKFDKQVLTNDSRFAFGSKADAICPEERGAKRIRNLLSRWHTLPPEAFSRS